MPKKIFFIDFDGTLIEEDSIDLFFKKLIPKKDFDYWDGLWNKGKIGSEKCLTELFKLIKDFDKNDVCNLINELHIRPGVLELLSELKNHNVDIYLVSDGFDFIINTIIGKNLLNLIKGVYCNKVTIGDKIKFLPYSKYYGECLHKNRCALCKESIVLSLIKDNHNCRSFYIGNGKSDVCGAKHCDLIYAREYLFKEKNISREKKIPFDNFFTIMKDIDFLSK